MRERTERATCAIAVIVALAIGVAAQSVLSDLLGELGRYLGAAARFTMEAIAGIENVEAAQIPSKDRSMAREELTSISRALSALSASNQAFVADLSAYSTRVRKEGFDAERDDRTWRSALATVRRISSIVRSTLAVVESNAWIKVALSDEDRLTLREVLLGRADLLQRLQTLPAPRTASELDQLDSMSGHYRQLISSLKALNLALTRATGRLR